MREHGIDRGSLRNEPPGITCDRTDASAYIGFNHALGEHGRLVAQVFPGCPMLRDYIGRGRPGEVVRHRSLGEDR